MCVRLCVCACMTPARPQTKSNCVGGGYLPVLGFCQVTTVSVQRPLMSLYLQPVLLISQVSETIAHSKDLRPSRSILPLRIPPLPLPAFLYHLSSLDRWGKGWETRRTSGSRALLSGASSNLIFQQSDPDRGRLAGNLSFSACTFNTEVIFLDSGYECTHKHPQPTVSFLCQIQ